MAQGFALRPEVYINNLDGKNRKISIPVCITIQPEVHILYALPVATQCNIVQTLRHIINQP